MSPNSRVFSSDDDDGACVETFSQVLPRLQNMQNMLTVTSGAYF